MTAPGADLGQSGGLPTIRLAEDGTYDVSWPAGRPESFTIQTVAFLNLVDEANRGARSLAVLAEVAAALTKLSD